ncbi:hypothetical protein AB9R08_00020 [Neisseria gonorrhoeae]
MNITKPGARIDRPTIRELIAYATCRNHPISNSTLLRMEKDGRIPCRLNPPRIPRMGHPRSFGSIRVAAIKKTPD